MAYQQSRDTEDQPQVRPFPMPTSKQLSTAYDNLYLAANGDDATRQELGNPALLPRPWVPASCTNLTLRAELWAWLNDVVTWLNSQYVWDPAVGMLPPCWPQHPHLVNEIAVLADQRRRANLDLTSSSLEEWHRYGLPNFYDRLRGRLHGSCDERHTPWPAQPRNTRHQRAEGLRIDAFNQDLGALRPTRPETNESSPSATPTLRLATEDGQSQQFD